MILDKFVKHNGRSYNVCSCDNCESFFNRRSDYRSFSLCIKCSNLSGGKKRSTHGENNKNSKLHAVWNNMLNRCRNPNNKRYKHYGARGISICSEWLDYQCFRDWCLLNGWNENLTIDRIDCSKNYSPNNCRFTDKSVQNANRGILRTNSSGFTGVWFAAGAYNARLQFRGDIRNIGRFKTMKDAVYARDRLIDDLGWPNQKSGIEKYTIDELKAIDKKYRELVKTPASGQHSNQ